MQTNWLTRTTSGLLYPANLSNKTKKKLAVGQLFPNGDNCVSCGRLFCCRIIISTAELLSSAIPASAVSASSLLFSPFRAISVSRLAVCVRRPHGCTRLAPSAPHRCCRRLVAPSETAPPCCSMGEGWGYVLMLHVLLG